MLLFCASFISLQLLSLSCSSPDFAALSDWSTSLVLTQNGKCKSLYVNTLCPSVLSGDEDLCSSSGCNLPRGFLFGVFQDLSLCSCLSEPQCPANIYSSPICSKNLPDLVKCPLPALHSSSHHCNSHYFPYFWSVCLTPSGSHTFICAQHSSPSA